MDPEVMPSLSPVGGSKTGKTKWSALKLENKKHNGCIYGGGKLIQGHKINCIFPVCSMLFLLLLYKYIPLTTNMSFQSTSNFVALNKRRDGCKTRGPVVNSVFVHTINIHCCTVLFAI